MKLSWSHKLFLRINKELGKNRTRDLFFLYAAHWLIYILGFTVLHWSNQTLDLLSFKIFMKLILTSMIFGLVGNWLMGMIWRHPRPHRELEDIKLLFNPVESWKSFPSDHTTISFIFVFVALLFQPPIWLAVLFFAMAVVVGTARVYTGVHYPRDILGGLFFALVYAALSFWLLENISQPFYDFIVR